MTALAPVSDYGASSLPQTTYYVVLHTEPVSGAPSTQWTKALRLLSALAEESPGYLGYDVETTTGGHEYAVTHWAAPEYIDRWKKSCHLLEGDRGLLERIFGNEGCIWPWMAVKAKG